MKVPLFALLAAVAIFTALGCGKGTPPGYHLYALFTRPQSLQPGDPVIMAGVQVGFVDSITLNPAKAETRVTMHIQGSVVVKTDTTATIISMASPGNSRIVLDPGSPGAPAAQPGTILITKEKYENQ